MDLISIKHGFNIYKSYNSVLNGHLKHNNNNAPWLLRGLLSIQEGKEKYALFANGSANVIVINEVSE